MSEPLSDREKRAIANIAESTGQDEYFEGGMIERLTRLQEANNRTMARYLEWRRFYGADLPRPWRWRAKRWVVSRWARIRCRIALWIAPELEDY